MILLCLASCLALSGAKRWCGDVVRAAGWSFSSSADYHFDSHWAFSFVLKTRSYPVVFLQLFLGTLLRKKDLTAFSCKWVLILMTEQGYSGFFATGWAPRFCPKLCSGYMALAVVT